MAIGHNCENSQEYHQLRGNDDHSLRYLESTKNGAVVLKIKIQIDKTSDNRALEQVDYLVSEYRNKNNMKQIKLANSDNANKE